MKPRLGQLLVRFDQGDIDGAPAPLVSRNGHAHMTHAQP
jgi:hypothetical protein